MFFDEVFRFGHELFDALDSLRDSVKPSRALVPPIEPSIRRDLLPLVGWLGFIDVDVGGLRPPGSDADLLAAGHRV